MKCIWFYYLLLSVSTVVLSDRSDDKYKRAFLLTLLAPHVSFNNPLLSYKINTVPQTYGRMKHVYQAIGFEPKASVTPSAANDTTANPTIPTVDSKQHEGGMLSTEAINTPKSHTKPTNISIERDEVASKTFAVRAVVLKRTGQVERAINELSILKLLYGESSGITNNIPIAPTKPSFVIKNSIYPIISAMAYSNTLFLIMPSIPARSLSLHSLPRAFYNRNPELVMSIAYWMLSTLSELEERGICHGTIHSENLLLVGIENTKQVETVEREVRSKKEPMDQIERSERGSRIVWLDFEQAKFTRSIGHTSIFDMAPGFVDHVFDFQMVSKCQDRKQLYEIIKDLFQKTEMDESSSNLGYMVSLMKGLTRSNVRLIDILKNPVWADVRDSKGDPKALPLEIQNASPIIVSSMSISNSRKPPVAPQVNTIRGQSVPEKPVVPIKPGKSPVPVVTESLETFTVEESESLKRDEFTVAEIVANEVDIVTQAENTNSASAQDTRAPSNDGANVGHNQSCMRLQFSDVEVCLPVEAN